MDPCVYNTRPIGNPQHFIDRIDNINEVLQGVTKSVSKSFVVVGGRRTGKTSLLFQVENRLTQVQKVSGSNQMQYIPAYYNFQQLPSDWSEDDFYGRLLLRILDRLVASVDEQPLESEDQEMFAMADSATGFERFERVLNRFFPRDAYRRLILLFDEVDRIANSPLARSFFGNLNEYINISGLEVALVLAAFDWPGFQRFALVGGAIDFTKIMLTPLDLDSTRELVALSEPHRYFSSELVHELHRQTGGHPYLLHSLLEKVCQATTYEVTQGGLGSAIKWFEEQNDTFFERTYILEFNLLDREFCHIMAVKGTQTKDQMVASFRDERATSESLARLLESLLVVRNDRGGYEIGSAMFKDYVLGRRSSVGQQSIGSGGPNDQGSN